MSQNNTKKPSVVYNGIAGIIAGSVSTVALHPLELIKTRMQVQDGGVKFHNGITYNGTFDALRKIALYDSPKALYQGLTINLIGNSTSWGLYFLLFNFSVNELKSRSSLQSGPLTSLTAGTISGVTTSFLTNPIWVIKTRTQLQSFHREKESYQGIIDAFKTISKEEGISGFYRGMLPGLIGVSHGALQFMCYEEIKKRMGSPENLGSFHYLVAAAISKLFASVSTYPYQVLRSRLQERPVNGQRKYTGLVDVVKKTWRNEGLSGFYRGLVPNVLRVTPGAVITFVVFENVMKLLTR